MAAKKSKRRRRPKPRRPRPLAWARGLLPWLPLGAVVAIAAVVVALVVFARESRAAPHIGDHWHAGRQAIGFQPVFLHLGGASTSTAVFVVTLLFVVIFILSFAIGQPPGGGKRLSLAWARSWLRASLPRLAVAALFSVVVFFASAQFGGGNGDAGVCDWPLRALGSERVNQEAFDRADAGLDQVIRLADDGDVDAAEAAFFSRVHDFTHNVDGPLRDSNDALATRLCKAVVQIEAEFAFGGQAATIAKEADSIRDLLRQAAAELGFAPRGE